MVGNDPDGRGYPHGFSSLEVKLSTLRSACLVLVYTDRSLCSYERVTTEKRLDTFSSVNLLVGCSQTAYATQVITRSMMKQHRLLHRYISR